MAAGQRSNTVTKIHTQAFKKNCRHELRDCRCIIGFRWQSLAAVYVAGFLTLFMHDIFSIQYIFVLTSVIIYCVNRVLCDMIKCEYRLIKKVTMTTTCLSNLVIIVPLTIEI